MPAALCFDMFGTLCDPSTATAGLRDRLDVADPVADAIADLWREKQLAYSYQVALMDAYEPFSEVTTHALEYALDYYGRDATAIDVDAMVAAYEQLSPYPDARATLDALAGRDLTLAVLSNGDPGMLETLADNAGLDEYFGAIVSADEVGTFKPAPAVYENAADRLGVDLDECWLVSANAWDAAGAAAAGMGVAWVDRAGEPYERIGGAPTATVGSLAELPEAVEE